MIKLNNVKITSPSSCTISRMDITSGERDSKGNMHLDYINAKWKIEVSWKALTQKQLSEILSVLENNLTFSVSFISPISGTEVTATFYKGDRTFPILFIRNEQAIWNDFKVNLIEV